MDDSGFHIASKARAKALFPQRLREVALKAHGYLPGEDYGLLADIATRCHVTRGAVTRWMSGSVPGIGNILKISEAYNVDPGWLVGNDAPQEAPAALSSRLSYDTITRVLRIMSEVRDDVRRNAGPDVSDEAFADVSVEVMRMVERDPDMPEYAITGAAYTMLKGAKIRHDE